jgi:hypothetical protein
LVKHFLFDGNAIATTTAALICALVGVIIAMRFAPLGGKAFALLTAIALSFWLLVISGTTIHDLFLVIPSLILAGYAGLLILGWMFLCVTHLQS